MAAPAALPAHGHGASHDVAAARGSQPAAPAAFTPLARRIGNISLTVHLTNFDGTVGASIDVAWQVEEGTTVYSGSGQTDASGNITFNDAVPAVANGQLYTWFGPSIQGWGDLTWSNGDTINLRPAQVLAKASRGGPWAEDPISGFSLDMMGNDRFSSGWVPATQVTPIDPFEGTLDTADGEYDRGGLYFFQDEGVELSFPSSLTLVSGVVTEIGPEYEAAAQRMTVTSPYWASGAPGSTIRVAISQFPAGWINAFSGQSEFPDIAPTKSFGSKTASGSATQMYTFKVPTNATAGYWYNVRAQHTNGLQVLNLTTPFQVCTMKPSKTSIAKGAKIRVKGVVPIYRHWGSDPGTPKTVTLYAHKGKAGVPTKKDPRSQGWVKVGSVKTTRTGAYTTPYFKPLKTLTLVVWYPGDPWWWEAYTSAKTVTVR